MIMIINHFKGCSLTGRGLSERMSVLRPRKVIVLCLQTCRHQHSGPLGQRVHVPVEVLGQGLACLGLGSANELSKGDRTVAPIHHLHSDDLTLLSLLYMDGKA